MSIFKKPPKKISRENVWARPKMPVTFRVEVMPGRSREERTFLVERVLSNGRVTLEKISGEHRQAAFEPVEFRR